MELHSKIQGQGPPIIILHGLFGTHDNWQTIANSLSNSFTVCLLDLRNHSRSPHNELMDYKIMATDVKEFMESNWINSAIVMGHSMGGKVAMQLALDNPDMVEKLIVVDISMRKYSLSHLEIFEALESIDVNKLKDRKEAETQLMEKLHDTSTVLFLLKNLSREKNNSFSWKMDLASIKKNYKTLMDPLITKEVFDKPTLFIRGGKSKHINDEDMPEIKTHFPQAKLETIDDAGHWVHADKPKELLNIIQDFMKKSVN